MSGTEIACVYALSGTVIVFVHALPSTTKPYIMVLRQSPVLRQRMWYQLLAVKRRENVKEAAERERVHAVAAQIRADIR
eukprot:145907-Rhodomonas_salina.1